MRFARKTLARNIETLRHGGYESIVLFLRLSRLLYEKGGAETLKCWITIAAPALPERERTEIITSLLIELLKVDDCAESEQIKPDYQPTLN